MRVYWDRYQSGLANADPEDVQLFRIALTIDYPAQVFRYETGFWYLLKWAFIQYAVLWLLVSWAVEKLERYVYGEYLVPTVRQLSDRDLLMRVKEKNY